MSNAGAPSVNRYYKQDLISSTDNVIAMFFRFDALSMQSSERSASPGPGGRMASRSVQGNMGGGGGGRSDFGRNDALQAVKNFGKQSVPNGPMGPGYGGAPAPAASSAAAAMRLEIGKTDDLIAVSQSEQLKGSSAFPNLDDEDIKEKFERRIVGILKEYIDQPNIPVSVHVNGICPVLPVSILGKNILHLKMMSFKMTSHKRESNGFDYK